VSLSFELLASDNQARRGRIHTSRGSIETPVFMPVGTRGAVIHLDQRDYKELDIEVVLGNTYHLMLRPGAQIIEDLGGLHSFASWDGHMLTDSGGFQVMSLNDNVKIDDDGVTFTSIYDGSKVRFTPEDAVSTQEQLGADIQMALDVCPALPSTQSAIVEAMERTHEWASRAKSAHQRTDQALFGIVQGGIDPKLRTRSAKYMTSLDFAGYGIDCVLPTRLARHGTVLTSRGKLNLRNAKHARDDEPLDPANPMSNSFSRAYLRHLMQVKEPTAARIATMHNLWFLLDLVKRARRAIEDGTYDSFRLETLETWV